MKTLADLEEIRKKTLNEIGMRANNDYIRIDVEMETSGIAAGAREVILSLLEELQKRNLHHVNVSATTRTGERKQEPIINVIDKEGKKVTYVNMTPEKVSKIVLEHIENGQVCWDYT